MSKEIIISVQHQQVTAVILEDGRFEEFSIERPADKTIVGNIYIGKITAVVPAVGAAFVDIGEDKNGCKFCY